ncbi:hypothetical protein ABH905_003978 [Pseudomonas frederiksbergensis]
MRDGPGKPLIVLYQVSAYPRHRYASCIWAVSHGDSARRV